MEPWTISLLGGTAFWLIDKYREKKKNGSTASAEPSPRIFTAAQAAQFTTAVGETRVWDKDIAAKLAVILRSRSAVPMAGELAQIGRAWRIVPLQPGAILASEVLVQAGKDKMIVLGSLSLVGLPGGSLEPMALVVCMPGGEQYTRASPQGISHFAVFPGAVPAPVAVPPEPAKPEVVKVAASVETPKAKPAINGAAKKEPSPPVVVHAEVPPDPGS